MKRKIIALSGYKGVGKDLVADRLVDKYNFHKKSFATKLKDMVSSIYGVPREYMDSSKYKEKPLHQFPVISTDGFTEILHKQLRSELQSGFWTPRALLILEGSSKRAVHSNYWVTSVVVDIMNNPDTNFVISDLRYKSEADTLKLLLPRIQLVRVHRAGMVPNTLDPSERDLDDYSKFNFVLDNSGTTKEQAYENIDNYINTTFNVID